MEDERLPASTATSTIARSAAGEGVAAKLRCGWEAVDAVNFFKYDLKAIVEGSHLESRNCNIFLHGRPLIVCSPILSFVVIAHPFLAYLPTRTLTRIRNDKGSIGEIYLDVTNYEPFQVCLAH